MSTSNRKIKAIIFDFIGVLLRVAKDYQANSVVDAIDREIGKVTDDDSFWKEIRQKFNLDEKGTDVLLEMIAGKYEPFEALWSLLPALREKYKLAIINNGTALTLPKFREKYDLDNRFDLFVSSAVAGLRKPDEAIYRLAAQRLGVAPEDCLFMDDSAINVAGAEKCGMSVISWESREAGLAEFRGFLDSEGIN